MFDGTRRIHERMIKWPLDLESGSPIVVGIPYRSGGGSSTGSRLLKIVMNKYEGGLSRERHFVVGPEVKEIANEAGDVIDRGLGV